MTVFHEHQEMCRPKRKKFGAFIQVWALLGLASREVQGFHSMTLMAIWAARCTASL